MRRESTDYGYNITSLDEISTAIISVCEWMPSEGWTVVTRLDCPKLTRYLLTFDVAIQAHPLEQLLP